MIISHWLSIAVVASHRHKFRRSEQLHWLSHCCWFVLFLLHMWVACCYLGLLTGPSFVALARQDTV